MKAVVLREHGGPDKLILDDVPVPEIGPDEVLIQVKATGLNHADLAVRQGTPLLKISLPLILGADVAGVVADVGANMTGIAIGDAVVVYPLIVCETCRYCRAGDEPMCVDYRLFGEEVDGGYAEFARVPARNVLPKPENLSFEEAASLPIVFLTAWHMLVTRARLRAGEDVLIVGVGGGVASAGIQIAKLCGARVFVTSSTEEKLEKAHHLGADVVINYRETDFADAVLEYTEGQGVDVAQDNVGAATWPGCLRSLARNGRLVTCGSHSGRQVEISIPSIYHRQVQIIGSNAGTRAEMRTVLDLAARGKLRPVVDRVLPLEQVQEAHGILERGEQFGKIILTP